MVLFKNACVVMVLQFGVDSGKSLVFLRTPYTDLVATIGHYPGSNSIAEWNRMEIG